MPNLTGLEDFAAPFVFDEQPTTLPADLRPTWRVALLTVTLRTCRGGRSSLQRLHVLNWALRSAEGIDELRRVLQGDVAPGDVTVRFEPAFIQAIDFAIGNGLVERVGGDKLQLLQRGRDLADGVIADSDLLVTEKGFLSGIKSLVAEARIREVVYRER